MSITLSSAPQAIVAAPSFCLGIYADDSAVWAIRFLEPCAELPAQNRLAKHAEAELRAYLTNARTPFTFPLRAQGTVFQQRVWRQIATIAYQQTASYGDLAKRLHSAPRAVGQACGANPLPIVVPCHRVIAANGALGGFARQRDGFLLDVKRWLLAHEGH